MNVHRPRQYGETRAKIILKQWRQHILMIVKRFQRFFALKEIYLFDFIFQIKESSLV